MTLYRQLISPASSSGGVVGVARALEAGATGAEDYQPAHVAFLAAAVIWVIIIICFFVLVALQYIRERDYLNASGRGKDVDWTKSLTRSVIMDTESVLKTSEADLSVRRSAVIDAKYNFQTLFLALVQASASMLILGGIQIDFGLTLKILFCVVCGWTLFLGIFATLWMSYVSETIGEDADGEGPASNHVDTDKLLHDLKNELGRSPLSFIRHFIELSFFKPMMNVSEIHAGDIYQDVGRDGSRTALLGVGQIILLTMYAWDVVDHGKPDLSNERLYSFYCCGIVMQIAYMSGQDILYKSIHGHLSFWGNVLRAARTQNTYAWEPPRYLLYHRPRMVLSSGSVRGFSSQASVRLSNTPFLWLRFLFSTIVNIGGLNIITLLLPLQLASNDDPLGFVMSSVGAYYILGIDDYSEPIIYKLTKRNNGRSRGVLGAASMQMEMARRLTEEDSDVPSSEEGLVGESNTEYRRHFT
mmetsp:Transcript_14426/g.31051  ORF Transcript_14426/g.31051 Transcript_14426/m.31051 type:complete len:471 (+) Transcript_14426:78-1490(+)